MECYVEHLYVNGNKYSLIAVLDKLFSVFMEINSHHNYQKLLQAGESYTKMHPK